MDESGRMVRGAAEDGPHPVDRHVGRRVCEKRIALGYNQSDLGRALGLTFQQIQKYEKGTNRVGASRLQHIATVLKVPVSFFFEDAPGTPEEAAGFAETPSHSYVVDFLSSTEGLSLNKSFVRIKDARVRRRIVDLVQTLAAEETDA